MSGREEFSESKTRFRERGTPRFLILSASASDMAVAGTPNFSMRLFSRAASSSAAAALGLLLPSLVAASLVSSMGWTEAAAAAVVVAATDAGVGAGAGAASWPAANRRETRTAFEPYQVIQHASTSREKN
jgi:hypothetical protein